ncbi:hypothetical protein Cni_G05308 [Canna indica]|uniref:Uncharacterized protein n=1 Tax=Canna indica TaxID=4628 RepID=A0AAQ3JV02_9LILI|nr:hypothetical protein Cni_G05308 [Canna indica]
MAAAASSSSFAVSIENRRLLAQRTGSSMSLPGLFLNENSSGRPWSCACYAHVGVELALDFFKVQNPSCVHDLETYIGLLKCPKMVQVHKNGVDLVEKARMMLRKQRFEGWPWQDVARQVGDLVQSLSLI